MTQKDSYEPLRRQMMEDWGAFGEKLLSAMRFGFGGHVEPETKD